MPWVRKGCQQVGQDEPRVAARPTMKRGDHIGRRRFSGDDPDELGCLVRAQGSHRIE